MVVSENVSRGSFQTIGDILQINSRLKEILDVSESKCKEDITDKHFVYISEDVLVETCNKLAGLGNKCFESNIGRKCILHFKDRKGEAAKERNASDVLELYFYLYFISMGRSNHFPKDLLGYTSK